MCGINGIFHPGGGQRHIENVGRMNDATAHRGPDDAGIFADGNIALGHRRLSIIDLSPAGRQPMVNGGNNVAVLLNGEIYNYQSLKEQLVSRGRAFNSSSDTEVLLRGYEEWGIGIIEKLEGMFAIAVWDARAKTLYLARDACGIKPLFYHCKNGMVVFSSEIKGILASGCVKRSLDPQALFDFLSLFYVPAPDTPLLDTRQVEAGTWIAFKDGNIIRECRYWDLLDAAAAVQRPPSGEALYEMIRNEAATAIKDSLVADVPVCLLLSAGLDSSIILYELNRMGKNDVKTVTIGFDDATYDESPDAARLAADLGFENKRILLPAADMTALLEQMVFHTDALSANPANMAEWIYFAAVAKEHKVVLMGSGNDELYAGYSTYIADRMRRHTSILPSFIKKLMRGAAAMLPPDERKYSFDYLAQKFTQGLMFPREKSHYWWRTIFSDDEKAALLNPAFVEKTVARKDSYYAYERYLMREEGRFPFEDRTLYADFYRFLVDNANMEVDQLSMGRSLEARPPFLSKRFAAFSMAVPFHEKLRGSSTKHCLRQAYRGKLPDYILMREKHGLVAPLHFIKKPENREMIIGHLLRSPMADYFNIPAVERMYHEHASGKKSHAYKLYALLCFSIWHGHFIEK